MTDSPNDVQSKAQETLLEELGRQSKLPGVRITVLIVATILTLWFTGLQENVQAWTGLIQSKTPPAEATP